MFATKHINVVFDLRLIFDDSWGELLFFILNNFEIAVEYVNELLACLEYLQKLMKLAALLAQFLTIIPAWSVE